MYWREEGRAGESGVRGKEWLRGVVSFPGLPHIYLDCLQYAKNGGRRPGVSYYMIHGTNDVTCSGRREIFTLVSSTLEKAEKQDRFQLRDNITESEAEPLKDDCNASVANPKAASTTLAKFCHCVCLMHVIC